MVRMQLWLRCWLTARKSVGSRNGKCLKHRGFDLLSFSADDPRRISDARVEDIPLLGVAIIFDGFLSRPAERGWKPEYLVPHFVMDAAKLAGFAGIRHESAKDRGINLVIFDPEAPLLAINAPEKMRLNDPARDPFHFDGPAIDMSALL
jgi:hypothetical protein